MHTFKILALSYFILISPANSSAETRGIMSDDDNATLEIIVAEYNDLYKVLEANNGNVHAITSSFFKKHLPTLYDLDRRYLKSSDNIQYEEIRAEISQIITTQYLGPDSSKHLETIMHSMETYRNDTDPETGAHVGRLLSMVWDLSIFPEDGKLKICSSLAENILEKGGCLAGVAGRLAQDYLALLRDILLFGNP